MEQASDDIMLNSVNGSQRVVGGLYSCCLGDVSRFDYADDKFCRLVGFSERDLFEEAQIECETVVHPDDVPAYRRFLKELSKRETMMSLRYRVQRKAGSVISVYDTMFSIRRPDGSMRGFSVVTDGASFGDGFRTACDKAAFVEDPCSACGLVEFSYADDPRIIFVNDAFLRMLGASDEGLENGRIELESFVGLMSGRALSQLIEHTHPRSDTESLAPWRRCGFVRAFDGSQKMLEGWVVPYFHGDLECRRLICVPTSDRFLDEEREGARRVVKAMDAAFDLLSRTNRNEGAVVYGLHGVNDPSSQKVEGGGLSLSENALDNWLKNAVVEEYREDARLFIEKIVDGNAFHPHSQICGTGVGTAASRRFDALLMNVDSTWFLFCKATGGHGFGESGNAPLDNGRPSAAEFEVIVEPSTDQRVRIQTFGNFEVFLDGVPLIFGNSKVKELLAILVDHRGGLVTSRKAASLLWEDELIDEKTLARYRKAVSKLNAVLKENGIEDIIERVRGGRRINPSRIQCDLYDYLEGKGCSKGLFRGSYMREYSWSEPTLAELLWFDRDKAHPFDQAFPDSFMK